MTGPRVPATGKFLLPGSYIVDVTDVQTIVSKKTDKPFLLVEGVVVSVRAVEPDKAHDEGAPFGWVCRTDVLGSASNADQFTAAYAASLPEFGDAPVRLRVTISNILTKAGFTFVRAEWSPLS